MSNHPFYIYNYLIIISEQCALIRMLRVVLYIPERVTVRMFNLGK